MNGHDAARLSDGLRALAGESAHVEAPAGMETALRTAFRRRQSVKKWRRVVITSGIAASIVMLIASAIIRMQHPRPAGQAHRPAVEPVVVARQTSPIVEPERPAPREIPARANRELVTGFYAVMGTDPQDLRRGGSMMRVRLPRSAMASFGLPVHPDRYSETVAADVLLGEDGLARAIRFVR